MTPLADAVFRERYGGKGAQLAAALRAGLPVPDGFALSVELAAEVAEGRARADVPDGRWAVRSSAVDEDGGGSSFAGQHATLLHVRPDAVAGAVRHVLASGRTESALAYRARLGLPAEARMAVVVQRMVDAQVAGVMFTRNPTTGADELVVEAAWGLGEVVVQGLVTPDSFRLSRDGQLLDRRLGHKDVEVVPTEDGTEERAIDDERALAPTLGEAELVRLAQLASRLAQTFEGEHDVEFAFDRAGALFLLQRRSITR